MDTIGKSTWRKIALLITFLLAAGLLAACGEEATPVPPTPTPPPNFQVENNPQLFFTMNVPFGWRRVDVDATTVIYQDPTNENNGIGVVSRQVGSLTPDSQRILQERTDKLKQQFPALREDLNGGGTITLVDTTIGVNRLTYTNQAAVDVVQFLAQANNIKAQRAYILFGITTAKEVDKNRPRYIEAFRSFTSTAAERAADQSNLADPTVLAANAGGKVRPLSGQEEKGRVLRLVSWETPPLTPNLKQPRITGLFPYDFGWRIRPFTLQQTNPGQLVPGTPQPTNVPDVVRPSIYLDSPKVDRTSSEAIMQFIVHKDAFASVSTPSADDWRKFYSPIMTTLVNQVLNSYANNVTVSDVQASGQLYRAVFTTRDDSGVVQSRGTILFSRSGTHGLVSILSLSEAASIKQERVEGYDADFQRMVNSFSIKF